MAREDARNCHDFSKMIRLFSVVSLLTFQGAVAQRVKVEAEVVSYPSQTVTLRCAFTDAGGIQLTQVSWIYEPKDGTRTNIAVFHPNFGPNYPTSPLSGRVSFTANPPILSSPSIQISNVQMTDEGKYVCEFATYPSGNEQGIISLVMLAKPRNSASEVTVMAPAVATGAQPVVVARCVSADGRPAAQITWVTTVNGKATTVSTAGSNNTVNVTSEYMLVPTPDDNGKDISCVVSHRTQSTPQSIPLKLAIEHLPQVTITGYDNNWYIGRSNAVLTCEASANPIPTTFTWKTLTGVMPNNVVVNEKVLNVPNVDELVNTTFICEAQNRLGTGKDQLTVLVRATRLPEVGPATASIIGAIIGVIVLLAIIGSVVAVVRKKRDKMNNGDGPPKYKPPPPKKQQSTNHSSPDRQIPEDSEDRSLDLLNEEPITDLDAYTDEVHHGNTEDVYYVATYSEWVDPGLNKDPPLYAPDQNSTGDYYGNQQDHHPASGVTHGESFISKPVFV